MLPYPWAGPAVSLALVLLVLFQRNRSQRNRLSRFIVALAYYLAGSSGIPQASAVFFGPGGHWAEGVALWIGSSALLALGWTFADRPWKAAGVLLFDALVPPLSFFDWMSPLASSGVLFPGGGLFGVAALLIGVSAFPYIARHRSALPVVLAIPLLANVLWLANPPRPAMALQGVNLHLGPSTHSILANFQRMQSWVFTADQHKQAKVLLLPETLLTWWSGNAQYVQQHVPVGQTWLVGASIPLKRGYFADGIEAVTSRGSKMVFASVLPVPVSMWRPWHSPTGDAFGLNNYKAFWWQRPIQIGGETVWASICYDQLLPFSWLEAALYRPETVLLTSNVWWARNTGIPNIQRASSWAWARLAGSTTVRAENA